MPPILDSIVWPAGLCSVLPQLSCETGGRNGRLGVAKHIVRWRGNLELGVDNRADQNASFASFVSKCLYYTSKELQSGPMHAFTTGEDGDFPLWPSLDGALRGCRDVLIQGTGVILKLVICPNSD